MEDREFFKHYLIQEITRHMEALREEFPEVEMKMYVASYEVQEDMEGNSYIDALALDRPFTFIY